MDNNVLEKTEETEEKPKFSQIKNQYLAVFIGEFVLILKCYQCNGKFLSFSELCGFLSRIQCGMAIAVVENITIRKQSAQ